MRLTGGLKALTVEDMSRIHEAAMSIIGNPGLKVENEEILKRLKAKGIPVDFDTGLVTLPSQEVDETTLKEINRVVEQAEMDILSRTTGVLP